MRLQCCWEHRLGQSTPPTGNSLHHTAAHQTTLALLLQPWCLAAISLWVDRSGPGMQTLRRACCMMHDVKTNLPEHEGGP